MPKLSKRFYKNVGIEKCNTGFRICLDGRFSRTPGGKIVELPNIKTAELVANEWSKQIKHINLETMFITRLVNFAIEKVENNFQVFIKEILSFAGSDLLCYRVTGPKELVAIQQKYWNPVLSKLESNTGICFKITEDITSFYQPKDTIYKFSKYLKKYKMSLELACLYSFTMVTGSAILALSVIEGWLCAKKAWIAANVDETWNNTQWGTDEQKQKIFQLKKEEVIAIDRLIQALYDKG